MTKPPLFRPGKQTALEAYRLFVADRRARLVQHEARAKAILAEADTLRERATFLRSELAEAEASVRRLCREMGWAARADDFLDGDLSGVEPVHAVLRGAGNRVIVVTGTLLRSVFHRWPPEGGRGFTTEDLGAVVIEHDGQKRDKWKTRYACGIALARWLVKKGMAQGVKRDAAGKFLALELAGTDRAEWFRRAEPDGGAP